MDLTEKDLLELKIKMGPRKIISKIIQKCKTKQLVRCNHNIYKLHFYIYNYIFKSYKNIVKKFL